MNGRWNEMRSGGQQHGACARAAMWSLGLALGLGAAALAAEPIAVPNGDFSVVANSGTVGGGALGGVGSNQLIGLGPWTGTYHGILGLLAPPTLTIDAGAQTATINGLAGMNVAGLLNNGGYFAQSLPTSYEFGRFYVLSAEVDVGSALSLQLLSDSKVGIALRSGDAVLASSTGATPELVQLMPLAATNYQLRFGHLADVAAVGPIGVQLFNEPTGLLTLDLLGSVTFRNVALEVRDIGAASAIEVLTTGDLLQAPVGEPFSGTIVALVRDEDGDGVPGHLVTFTAPTEGASAILTSSTGGTGPVVTAVTDLDGLAVVSAQANAEAGCYRVMAEGVGLPELAVFHLRNYSHEPGVDSVYCNGFQ
jgi:hypothetical protein